MTNNQETSDVNQSLFTTEELTRQSTSNILAQQQALMFVNRKVDAVGTVLLNAKDLLSALQPSDQAIAELVTKVSSNQQQLFATDKKIEANWQDIHAQQTDFTADIEGLTKTIDRAHDDKAATYEKFNNMITSSNDQRDKHISGFSERLDKLMNAYQTAGGQNDVKTVTDQANALIRDIQEYQLKRAQEQAKEDQRIEKLAQSTDELSGMLKTYQSQLDLLHTAVDNMDQSINRVTGHLAKITPARYNKSTDDILNIFANTSIDDAQSMFTSDNNHDDTADSVLATDFELPDTHNQSSEESDTVVSIAAEEAKAESTTPEIKPEETIANETTDPVTESDEPNQPQNEQKPEPVQKTKSHWRFWK